MDRSPLIQSLSSSLHVDISRFLATTVRISRQNPQGRRWSVKEKALALSTLKCGPNSYTFLGSLFPLPSRLTLQTVLNTVHFIYLTANGLSPGGSGYNPLGQASMPMCLVCSDALYRQYLMKLVCCLMFDEMPMNRKSGCTEGFEDLGSHGRTSRIANHALVFMLCGLHKKWKESVAYYLIHRSIKGEMLVNFCKLVPPCVTRVNSVKVLKHLGVSEKTSFFLFQNQEVANIFDPPCLLKGTCNIFQKHDVANVVRGFTANGE